IAGGRPAGTGSGVSDCARRSLGSVSRIKLKSDVLPLPVLPTFFMNDISLYKQSSSSPNLPLVPCKEASHGRRTVRHTVPRGPTRGHAPAAAQARAVQRRGDPAGGVLGGPARPPGPLGVRGPQLARRAAVGGVALAGNDEPAAADAVGAVAAGAGLLL